MNKKELILKTKEYFSKRQNSSKKLVQESEDFFKETDSNLKQLEFIKWYQEKIPDFKELDIINFIDKMAIWYEFRYPKQFIDTLFCEYEIKDNNKENIFQELNDLVNWKDLFDYETFIIILNNKEKELLEEVKFKEFYKLEKDGVIYFDSDGKITKIETCLSNEDLLNINKILNNYIGKNANELVSILMEYSRFFDAINIYDLCNLYNNKILFKEKLLEMVLDKIIERCGIKLGFLFILEFKLNINLLENYISNNDLNKIFIYEYLKVYDKLKLNKEENDIFIECKDLDLSDKEKEIHENVINLLNLKKVLRNEEINLDFSYQKVLKKNNLSI